MEFLDHIREYKNQIYREVCAILLFGGVFTMFHSFFGVGELGKREWLLVGVIAVYLFLFTILRMKGRASLIAVAGIFGVVKGLTLGMERLKEVIPSYIDWLTRGGGEETYLPFYEGLQILWLVLGCMVIAFLLSISKKIRYATCVLVVASLVGFLVSHMQVSKQTTACFMAFLLMQVAEILEDNWDKKRTQKDQKASIVWLWPVWILFLVGMLLVPSSQDPYQWTFVKKAIHKVGDELTLLSERIRLGNGEGFEMRMSGFSGDGNVGGNLEESDREVLYIRSSKTPVTNLYLGGIVMDTFDGREWKTTKESTLAEQRMDVLETYCAVDADEEHRISDYLSAIRLDITYTRLSSAKYFWPLKGFEFYAEKENLLEDTKNTQKLLKKKKKYQDAYAVNFYQMNLHQSVFDELFTQNDTRRNAEEDRWDSVCRRYGAENISYEKLLAYRAQNRELYGQVPKLSDEMRAWVEEVTGDSENDYQKLCAIEAALQGMTYVTSPGELPKEVDSQQAFLDYFVLEKQSGYCTYFATAMTLLARSQGYPARYVQGFCVPMKGQKEYSVKSRMSHAWCEVYFEGIGWIPFEPTGGYQNVRYTPWSLYVEQDVEMPDFSVRPQKHEDEAVAEEIPEEETDQTALFLKRARMFFITVFLLAVAFGGILALDILIGRSNYKKKNRREKYRQEAERNLALLRKMGVKRASYETLAELGVKMAATYSEWEEECPTFLAVYEEVLYGDMAVTDLMIDYVREERKKMLAHINKWAGIGERYYLLKTSGKKSSR